MKKLLLIVTCVLLSAFAYSQITIRTTIKGYRSRVIIGHWKDLTYVSDTLGLNMNKANLNTVLVKYNSNTNKMNSLFKFIKIRGAIAVNKVDFNSANIGFVNVPDILMMNNFIRICVRRPKKRHQF